ncbi:DEAD/DEAH box helicase [Tenuibacillus multivorans]|uniref:Superfamily II DNA or RNA helicase, SNF2 family n=1 Tax=Tenuibacillus multivorans TaxID=237069 RepID=A0A1G9YIT3_9BACI|nr:helicase-related protein [Tenuibacillus multivorans]GEL78692.1 helicase [Tenuibacillus multivorans]SDN08997.1 Superfamily II DNA or RNA helicase, SNF2 family [Tenuibacillus multivorans]
MLKKGEIVGASFWPEPVQIKHIENVDDDLFLIEAVGRESNQFFENYLEKYQLQEIEHYSEDKASDLLKHRFQHYLQYHVLRTEKEYSHSRVRGNKSLIPLPHQIEAVYSKMLQAPQVRYLLADDPGAGKTIMSGMLIRELKARNMIRKTLILVPPVVLKQWQAELKEKFDEDFVIITRDYLKASGEINPFDMHQQVIASMYWASREDIKNMILNAHFDLVIVDEAHKMAAYTVGQKKRKVKRTKMFQLGENLLRHSEHCLLLTATPHKGDKENFRHLMSLVDHDIFSQLNRGDQILEKSNPYVIRRLKENMVNFDGTPLFPKRTTKTLGFNLSPAEIDLYEAVTDYVRHYFNRAQQNNKPNVAFAMMILQRRLSSSVEAIYLSLVRRKERLQKVLETGQKVQQMMMDYEDYEDSSLEEQELFEAYAEGEFEELDFDELQAEIEMLDQLIRKANVIRQNHEERKFQELEKTLFGAGGLLDQGEKILIFTESKDTLNYLEKKLKAYVPEVAKIVGDFSMDRRQEEVEKFRNDVQIMIATDAGGESINLQFCNQMVNYDIPWNPNRLEQRMGRIHRIGQKNEVFVFNLVATNTREGDVLTRLLTKMEQMREDLGQDLVYDFVGEVLEDRQADLSSVMEQAITGREDLDEVIEHMEKTLSEEHKRLLELAQNERLDDQFDLPGAKRSFDEVSIHSIPNRFYGKFVVDSLQNTRTRMSMSADQSIVRIDRFPKRIRDFARDQKLMFNFDESIRFALTTSKESDSLSMVENDNALFSLVMKLTAKEMQQSVLPLYEVQASIPEVMTMELNQMTIVDGNGRELEQKLMLTGRRANGEFIQLSPYLIFNQTLDVINTYDNEEQNIKRHVIDHARKLLKTIQRKREDYANRKRVFLRKSFEDQMETLQERLKKYQEGNVEGKNSALINQTYAQIDEMEDRSKERLSEIDRERSIQLKPVKRVAQFKVKPNGVGNGRVVPEDYLNLIEDYELNHGRMNVRTQPAFGLVDFISEEADGESRLIVVTDDIHSFKEQLIEEDYEPIKSRVYVYEILGTDVTEHHMEQGLLLI